MDTKNQPRNQDTIAQIKEKSDCRSLFKKFWPDHYREKGNCVCPWHDDDKASLQVSKMLAHCHAESRKFDAIDLYQLGAGVSKGEAIKELAKELGLNGSKPVMVAEYDYRAADGKLLFQTVRMSPKAFRQRRPDGVGGWIWNLQGIEPVPYRLQEVLAAQEVFIVEGEKDADRLATLGLAATTSPMGAGKWRDSYSPFFAGKSVFILPDNDQPGREHADKIALSLLSHASSVKVLTLPGLPEKGDVSDWLDNGGSLDELKQIAWKTEAFDPQAAEGPLSAFDIDFSTCHAARFLDSPPPPIEWTLKDSLAQANLAYLVSDGGVGKGFLSLQLGLSVTTGIPFLDGLYDTGEPGRAVLIFGEDDELTLHHRLSGIVQNLVDFSARKDVYELLLKNLFLLSVTGQDTRLIQKQDGNLIPSFGYNQLVERLQAIDDLKLVVLDPLSRFYVGDENNTADATYFSSLLEKIARETGATVLVSAHTNKAAIQGKTGIEALVQHAIRGSTGFTNAARWQLNLAKVSVGEWKHLGLSPNEIHRYLVAKVTKKNFGPPERHFYLKRDQYGALRLAADVREGRAAQDEEVLAAVIDKIAEEERAGKRYTKVGFSNCFAKTWNNYGGYKLRTLIDNAILSGAIQVNAQKNNRGLMTDYLTVSVESEGFENG